VNKSLGTKWSIILTAIQQIVIKGSSDGRKTFLRIPNSETSNFSVSEYQFLNTEENILWKTCAFVTVRRYFSLKWQIEYEPCGI
jgi:hypothetical protein